MRINESITSHAAAYDSDGRLLDFVTFTATREDEETIAFDLRRGHAAKYSHMHPILLLLEQVPEGGNVLAPVVERADPVDRGARAMQFSADDLVSSFPFLNLEPGRFGSLLMLGSAERAIEDRAKAFGLAYHWPRDDAEDALRIAVLPDRAQAIWLTWVTTMVDDVSDRHLLVAAWRAWSALEAARIPF
ncbi:hypothetical protein [Alteriqipengyuania lutimaris]|uniref:Uncharacterized protein n=1 Tax=Alteriqipengyuania lutimaris TaxID=1538146 RepID=A0A395LMC3_9SPHN|nr:hypothetical protein [Alteriqipengyuania lutimaris]MBB3033075.1 hypothetical protein [Alteriqipengyuania lutimaris]RDS77859.1 hypothetical protein DL238_09765 [Alteriqipengyuania lutimaris]